MDIIKSKVEKQELEITFIKRSLDELIEQNKNQNLQLSKISDSIQKQEIILEKIGNLEDKYNDGLKRCHNRIDTELVRLKDDTKTLYSNIGSLRDELNARPCQNHNIVDKEIEFIKGELSKYNKIIWWSATLIIGVVIIAILKEHFK